MPSRFFTQAGGEVLRIEGSAPRTIYLLMEPSTTQSPTFAMGTEEVDPGSEIPAHLHPDAEEIIFVYGGQGKAMVGDEEADISPGTGIYIPRNTLHRFINTGQEVLRLTWTFIPPGFEHQMRRMARESR
ncbi:MAG: cupin domain-containing protein [Nitrospinota bacterium]|nr:MAG: cupin domain-containing protein [Nitrospinota bacterium]